MVELVANQYETTNHVDGLTLAAIVGADLVNPACTGMNLKCYSRSLPGAQWHGERKEDGNLIDFSVWTENVLTLRKWDNR